MRRTSIVGGRVFTGAAFEAASLNLEDGYVRDVGGAVPAQAQEVNAAGLLVLPGAIDAHVHGRDPGFPAKETFLTLTRAAAAGGVTAVLDMPNNRPAVDSAPAFELKLREIEPKAVVDYGLYAVIRSTTTPETVQALAEAGVIGFKAYLGYSWRRSTREVVYAPGAGDPDLEPPPDYAQLAQVAPAIAATGLPLVVHCEDPAFLRRPVGDRYADLLDARPDTAEAAAVTALNRLAGEGAARFHVAHLSSRRGLEAALAYRGGNRTLEVTPNHLWRTEEDYSRVGNLLKMFPPVRSGSDREALRDALWAGDVHIVATDHAPHTDEEKLARPLREAAPGSPGVQTLVVSSLELAAGRGDVARAVPWFTRNPARIFHLEGKGGFEPGADGDVVLVDPAATTTVRPEEMLSRQKHSALEGMQFRFRVRAVYLRGEPAGRPGSGRLLRPGRRT